VNGSLTVNHSFPLLLFLKEFWFILPLEAQMPFIKVPDTSRFTFSKAQSESFLEFKS